MGEVGGGWRGWRRVSRWLGRGGRQGWAREEHDEQELASHTLLLCVWSHDIYILANFPRPIRLVDKVLFVDLLCGRFGR